MAIFSQGAEFYDVFYGHKNHRAEVEHFLGLSGTNRPESTPKKVLELGMGTGRHAAVLESMGVTVHGVEMSASMLDKIPVSDKIIRHLGDARTIRLPEKFDSVFSFFHVASYQTRDDDIHSFFATARAHLNRGGTFVFDCWYSPGVIALKPAPRILTGNRDDLTITRKSTSREEVDKSLVFVLQEFVVQDSQGTVVAEFGEEHTMRHFSTSEIRHLARSTDFRLAVVVDPESGGEPGRESWAATYCLEAI